MTANEFQLNARQLRTGVSTALTATGVLTSLFGTQLIRTQERQIRCSTEPSRSNNPSHVTIGATAEATVSNPLGRK